MIKISNGMFYENIDKQYKKLQQPNCEIAKRIQPNFFKYKSQRKSMNFDWSM